MKSETTAAPRRNVWIRRDLADLVEQTRKHRAISFQATLEDFLEDALRAVGMIPDTKTGEDHA